MKDEKIIYNLLKVIVIAACILIVRIFFTPKYDPKIYDEVYAEYNEMVENNEETEENNSENTISENVNDISDTTSTDNNSNVENVYTGINSGESRYKVDGKIIIPKIRIEYPVIYKTTDEYLKVAPTKLAGPEMNQVGNYCIAGHNYYNDQFFSKISQLQMDDVVFLTSKNGKNVRYVVYDKYEVYENDLSCTNQDTNGRIEATLVTCTTQKQKRLVVKCVAN